MLLNNAYLYASKEERATMNKSPHYRQSAIVFTILGGIFLVIAIDSIIHNEWLVLITIGLSLLAIVYAIVSSVLIEKINKS